MTGNRSTFRPRSAVLLFVCTFAFAESNAREPAAPDPARFAKDIADFEAYDRQNAFPADAVLFVGSSSIRLWNTAEAFPEVPVINRGFGGSVVADSVHYAPRIVLKYRPRVIVFYAGDNDIAASMSPQRVFDDFQKFVELVHRELPDTRIIYLPIKPSRARWSYWPKMQDANSLIADLASRDERLEYVDTATALLGPDGTPQGDIFLSDGLHMNARGYAIWNEILAPVLRQSLAPN